MSRLSPNMPPASAFFFSLLLVLAKSAFPPSLRYPLPVAANKIMDVGLTCDSTNVNATITLQYPFKGLLFAKDFSQECHSIGTATNILTISLPTSGCGVRLSSRTVDGKTQMWYGVVLVVQQDRHLRQIADQEKYFECPIEDDAFAVKSSLMAEAVKKEWVMHEKVERNRNRTSRMKKHNNQDQNSIGKELNEALEAARAWMEITPEDHDSKRSGTLQVGESVILTVKSTLPAGIGWKVVDCTAHDGQGDSSQKLLDEDGCPVDELLLPIPELGPIQPISLMKHQEAISKFAAFKFPDRDRLHLSCLLELCRGYCREVDCSIRNRTGEARFGRTLSKGAQGEIIDRLQVFNSVEVLAPSIDDLTRSERLQLTASPPDDDDDGGGGFPFPNLPGDRTFCVSPEKVAVTFCVLGLIFLFAVIVAACALYKARRNSSEGPFYTRSLFSSSSGGSGYGSKLLLHESPCMNQSTSRGMPYGRIL